ncbi:MAG: hypothetical protein C1943_18140 [Halochromatium sp.]|nr:hypothetical protein [Halochromatium sp.]
MSSVSTDTMMNRLVHALTATILIVSGLGASPTAHAFAITRNGHPWALIQKLLGLGVTVIGQPKLNGCGLSRVLSM